MSWTRFAATMTGAVLAGWTTCAMAADQEFGRSGPYLAGGGLYAFESFDGDATATNPDDSWGYDVKGGYRFNEYFAIEANWQHMVGFDDGDRGDVELWMIGANAKFFPLQGIFQPYALAGMGWSSVDDSRAESHTDSTGMGFLFGGGLDVYVTRNWAFYFQASYLLQTGGRDEYDAVPLTFGVLYRFY